MPKASTSQEKKVKGSGVEEKETRKSVSKPKVESPYSKFVENVVKVSGKTENNGKRSTTKAEEGEKQNKKSKSKKMEIKHQKKNEESSVSPKKEKSPSHKMKASKKFVNGPARATSAIPHSRHLRLAELTGTGLAPPKTGAFNKYKMTGTIIDMYGSIFLMGFKVRRPASLAVLSPSQ
jgi:hypothetical protein